MDGEKGLGHLQDWTREPQPFPHTCLFPGGVVFADKINVVSSKIRF